MKYLKTYENWSDEDLRKYHSDRMQINELLKKYLKWKLNIKDDNYLGITDFIFDRNGKFMIEYISYESNGTRAYYTPTPDEYNEIIQFMNNTEVFIDSKKFNL